VRIVILGPLPDGFRESLAALPGNPVVLDHPDPASAAAALGIADVAVSTFFPSSPFSETLHALALREAARAERYGRAFAIVLLAVDDAERLAADHGRDAVAAYLASMEDALRRSLRRVDLLLRDADGRLAALLPETEGEGARTAAVRLRDLAAKLIGKPATGGSRTSLPFRGTVSAGVAWIPTRGIEGGEALLRAAELALAAARREGGGRVLSHDAPPG
jgi:diguanylate cyclase (GGDEF)-like protein